jgi:hypothetical protein
MTPKALFSPRTTMAQRSYGRITAKSGMTGGLSKRRKPVKASKKLINVIDSRIRMNTEVKTYAAAAFNLNENTAMNYGIHGGLVKGATGGQRQGDRIKLKGVRVEYAFRNQDSNVLFNAVPTKYEVYLVRTQQADLNTLQAQWFQNTGNEFGLPWSTYNGTARIVNRKNPSLETYEIMGYKCMDLFPENNGIGPSAASGVWYFKIPNGGEIITFRDNQATGGVAPLNTIFPRYVIFAYCSSQIGLAAPVVVPANKGIDIQAISYFEDA